MPVCRFVKSSPPPSHVSIRPDTRVWCDLRTQNTFLDLIMEGNYMIFTFIRVTNYDTVFEHGPVSMHWWEFSVTQRLEVVDCRAPICKSFYLSFLAIKSCSRISFDVILKWDTHTHTHVHINPHASNKHVQKLKWEIRSASVGLHWGKLMI